MMMVLAALALAGCANDLTNPGALEGDPFGPPTNFSAVPGNGVAYLHWDAPNSAASVRVHRGTESGALTHVRTVPADKGTTVDGLTNGVTYYFAVDSVHADGHVSERTREDSARPVLHECKDRMDEVTAARGSPEEVNTYTSGGYQSHDWWYWSQGYEVTFTWGTYVTGCEVSVYTFDPIY